MGKYNFIEHTADIAVDVTAGTLKELFETSAKAWLSAILEIGIIKEKHKKTIQLQAESLEELLVNFINEINYFFLTKKWVTAKTKVTAIKQISNHFNLTAEIYGEEINHAEYNFKEEIKAVTYHQLKIKQKDNLYTTRIVFDI